MVEGSGLLKQVGNINVSKLISHESVAMHLS